jgi:hypothetical protein
MSGGRRLDRHASDEPSLGLSFGVLCLVLLAMIAIVANISVPDLQFVQSDLLVGL